MRWGDCSAAATSAADRGDEGPAGMLGVVGEGPECWLSPLRVRCLSDSLNDDCRVWRAWSAMAQCVGRVNSQR